MYETGQEVPASGIYKVTHDEHRLPHDVTLVAGQKFPSCGRCSSRVRFRLLKESPRLSPGSTIIVHELSSLDKGVSKKRRFIIGDEPLAA